MSARRGRHATVTIPIYSVMPKGVEHQLTVAAMDGSGLADILRDAERR